MKSPRPLLAVLVVLTVACTGDGDELAEPASESTSAEPATSITTVSRAASTSPVTTAIPSSAPPSTAPPVTSTVPPDTVPPALPEVGVPGLDSEDAFCAAWSRWAGTYQVLLVTNAFGTGGSEALASLEVVAAPVLVEAAATMEAVWPDAIAAERDLAADRLLGPITRRLTVARQALVDAGADASVLATIETGWLAGLAARDPSTPDFAVDLPDEVWAVVDRAAADFAGRLVPFASDPSLVIDAETPLTDDYLVATCPDRGTLSGQEIDPDATAPATSP